MRTKLQRFTQFTQTLLPHEMQYLLSMQHLEDPIRLQILERLDHNCRQINQFTPFDAEIDKRKYSHLKNWISERLDALAARFDYLDRILSEGKFYSRRILLNYYHLRMLLYARLRETDRAVHYGYLSIRGRTHDYLFYVNNLSAVLLRARRYQEALVMMRGAIREIRETKNFYNKIGFVAFYVKSLTFNQMNRNAESYAETFLKAFEKEILQYRWHTFFAAYLENLIQQQKYPKILKIVEKYRLLERERRYESRADYIPAILWYASVAQYKEGQIDRGIVRQRFEGFLSKYKQEPHRPQVSELLTELRPLIPEIVNYLSFIPAN